MQEREMTKKDKAKEKRLKKKYDDSDMKKSMKKQYGDDWKNVYYATIRKKAMEDTKRKAMDLQGIMPGDRIEQSGQKYEVIAVDGDILTVDNLQTSNRTQFRKDDVTRIFGMDAMTDKDKDDLSSMFNRLKKGHSGSLKHVATEAKENTYTVVHAKHGKEVIKATSSYGAAKKYADMKKLKSTAGVDAHLMEGYQVLPNIDKERYTPIQGMEGPFMTVSGKALYYDPSEGSYYDRDTDMFLSYDEFKQYDEPRTPIRSEAENLVKNLRAKVEGHSPHKKGTPKYKKHMAAKHAAMAEGVKRNAIYQQVGKMLAKGHSIDAIKKRFDDLDKANPGYLEKIVQALKDRNEIPHGKYQRVKGAVESVAEAKKTKHKVTVEQMKEALSIDDDDTSDEEVVASYVRTMLDESMDTWSKVFEEVQFVLSILKEGKSLNPNSVHKILMQRHMQEYFDDTMNIKENVDTLRKIVNDKQYQTVKFTDGSMKIDLTTASLFLQVFDKQRPEIQEKIRNKITTKQGFLTMLDLIYGKM